LGQGDVPAPWTYSFPFVKRKATKTVTKTAPTLEAIMQFLLDNKGSTVAEWIVVVAIVIGIVGGILLTLNDSVRARLEAINNAL
jgi:Flp pilus assembly pilin Flp